MATKIQKVNKTSRPQKAQTKPQSALTVKVFDLNGRASGTITLPKEVFGLTPNKNLLAQAIRIYTANSKPQTAHTKTRGEVRGGGAKPWKQKGTGRARAGSRRSPLWVGGGITFGPRAKEVKLELPQKMKHKALIYALSEKAMSKDIKIIVNLEKAQAKTKPMANLLKTLDVRKNALMVVSQKSHNLHLATRNISNLKVDTAKNLNAYEVLKMKDLLLSKEAVGEIK
jgi:large subunit ribosomal protein L4